MHVPYIHLSVHGLCRIGTLCFFTCGSTLSQQLESVHARHANALLYASKNQHQSLE